MTEKITSKRICFPTPSIGEGRRRIIFRVRPEDIAYVSMTLEAHDYLAICRTINQVSGVMEALCAPDYHQETLGVIKAMADELPGVEIISG